MGISFNAVTVVDMTIILPPRACVVVLFIIIVVHARTMYGNVDILFQQILTVSCIGLLHSLDVSNEKYIWYN